MAKFEDFTMVSKHNKCKECTFIAPMAFEHPINAGRGYLKVARQKGKKMAPEFIIFLLVHNTASPSLVLVSQSVS